MKNANQCLFQRLSGFLFTMLAASLTALPATPATAAPDFNRAFDTSILVRSDAAYRFETKRVTLGDRTLLVYAALPKKASAEKAPVLYALDGNPLLEALTPERLAQLAARDRAPVVVLIGYDTPKWSEAVRFRSYDYTPPCQSAEICTDDMHPDRPNGGADRLLDAIEHDVKPWVESLRAIDRDRQTLLGHSYGGLFVMHTLLTRPGLFTRYVAADPAMWWKGGALMDRWDKAEKSLVFETPVRLDRLSSGMARPRSTDAKTQKILSVRKLSPERAEAFRQKLAETPGLTVTETRCPNHTHGRLLKDSLLMSLDLAPQY